MCGIAGIVSLDEPEPIPYGVLENMSRVLVHRGPDQDGTLIQPGIGLASRRLSILDLAGGQQPVSNEDGTVWVVFNGELYDYAEERRRLESRGHRFTTRCDTELIPHLWEEHQEGLFERLRGQFAFALWDEKRRRLILARDRFGICPLFWTIQDSPNGRWLLFASEIKSLLASGLVAARPDRRGVNQVLTFFALPGPVTCFAGVNSLLPGRYLRVDGGNGSAGTVQERTYWDMDFPDQGQEDHGDADRLTDGLEAALYQATQRRLQSDVPVVSYLSGGLDSSLVVAMASKLLGRPIPTFSVRVTDPDLDESAHAHAAARHVGSQPVMVDFHPATLLRHFQRMIRTAEAPVVDTTSAATMLLAEQVHASGYKVALTGEGADEWLAGYPWYKAHKWMEYLDLLPGLSLSRAFRRSYLWWMQAPPETMAHVLRAEQAAGAYTAWHDVHALTIMSKLRFLSPEMRAVVQEHEPYADLGLNRERLRRWHPLNRSLYVGAKILMPGVLLSAKGDRAAMSASVETRYPFLDEDVVTFLAGVHPRWKLRGFREKYLLRRVAERWLPSAIAWRPKKMFRGPLDIFHAPGRPAYVDQLLSESSLKRAGYFDSQAVALWRKAVWQLRPGSHARTSIELGLTGVLATQLWHHEFFGADLCELTRRQETPGEIVA